MRPTADKAPNRHCPTLTTSPNVARCSTYTVLTCPPNNDGPGLETQALPTPGICIGSGHVLRTNKGSKPHITHDARTHSTTTRFGAARVASRLEIMEHVHTRCEPFTSNPTTRRLPSTREVPGAAAPLTQLEKKRCGSTQKRKRLTQAWCVPPAGVHTGAHRHLRDSPVCCADRFDVHGVAHVARHPRGDRAPKRGSKRPRIRPRTDRPARSCARGSRHRRVTTQHPPHRWTRAAAPSPPRPPLRRP
jgi:hypothetical protein